MAKRILASTPSSSPNIRKKGARRTFLSFAALSAAFFLAAGCGPKFTYPAASVASAVEKICKDEYKMDVQARVVGKTVGAVLDTDKLLDEKGQIPKEIHESMGKVMQVTARVALSTDLPLDFCTVLVRDKMTGNFLSMTRSVDDTKRAFADAIGIEESFNRTLFGQGRATTEQDETLALKDVKLETFLTDQIAQRIRFNYSRDAQEKEAKAKKRKGKNAEPDESENAGTFALVDGTYDERDNKRTFRFSVIGLKTSEDPHATILNVFKVVNDVLAGYKFSAFDAIEIQDYLNRLKLVLDKQTLLDYQEKKITQAQILERYLTESQSIQEAFKLFGFTLPQE